MNKTVITNIYIICKSCIVKDFCIIPSHQPSEITTFFPIAALVPIFADGWIKADVSIPESGNFGEKKFSNDLKKSFFKSEVSI